MEIPSAHFQDDIQVKPQQAFLYSKCTSHFGEFSCLSNITVATKKQDWIPEAHSLMLD